MYHPDKNVVFLTKYFFDGCHRMKGRGTIAYDSPRQLEVMSNVSVSANSTGILFSSTTQAKYGSELP